VITFRPIAKGSAANYFKDDLHRKSDPKAAAAYYFATGSNAPEWGGKLAEHFGIAGMPPTQEQLQRLLDGYHPVTGEDLVARRTKNRREGVDIVASAPKSVSVIGMFDDRMAVMVREADRFALAELENYAGVRVRAGGADHSEQTGKMIWMAAEHQESRELDPNFHCHHVAVNLTVTAEGKYRALDCAESLRRCRMFTEIFRNRLAEQLRHGGYELRQEKDGFEIVGVPTDAIKLYSKSRAKITEAERLMEERLGRAISNDERAVLAKDVKRPKNKKLSPEELRAYQLSQLDPETKAKLQALATNARSSRANASAPADDGQAAAGQAAIADECAEFAKRHVFERTTISETWRLAEHALRHSQGRTPWAQIKKGIGRLDLVREGTDCTTVEMQALERRIIKFAQDGIGRCSAFAASVNTDGLAPEQARLAETVVGSHDRVVLAQAPPGSGKSYALRPISAAIPHSICVAPTASAVEVLARDGIEAKTLDSFLHARASHRSIKTVIVDEASLMSTSQCSRLLLTADLHGLRLILSGDVRQNKSVGSGSPFSLLQQKSNTTKGELNIIRRQRPKPYRRAVKQMSRGRFDKAFSTLEQMGAIEECTVADERRQAAARFYCDSEKRGSVCAVAPTWFEIEHSTAAIRAERRARGRLGAEEIEVETFQNVDLSLAQRKHKRYWPEDSVAYFARRVGDVPLGTTGKFHGRAYTGDFIIEAPSVKLVPESEMEAIQAVRRRKIRLATGDKIQFQANYVCPDGRRITNGTTATVKSIEGGRIALDDGRVIPPEFRRFGLGYCVTSFAAQGQTADTAIAIMPSGGGINKRALFVSLSRGKEAVKLFVDDLETVSQQLEATSRQKEHAIEIVGTARRSGPARRANTVDHSMDGQFGQVTPAAPSHGYAEAQLSR